MFTCNVSRGLQKCTLSRFFWGLGCICSNTHTNTDAHTLVRLIRLCGQSAKQPNLFSLSVSLVVCVASALCFFKVPTLYVFLYLSAQCVSATVSLPLSAPFHTSLAPSPSLCYFLSRLRSLPVYFYISYVVLLIRNLTYTASSCLSASQKLLSPALICRLACCFSNSGKTSIIRITVTVANSVWGNQTVYLQTAWCDV